MDTIGIGIMRFTISSETGDPGVFAQIKHDLDLYAESVHRILQTTPGERPREPKVGCELRQLLFEPNEFYLQRSAEFIIRLALSQQEPRLEILAINVESDINAHKLQVKLFMKVKVTGQTFSLTEEVNYGQR